MKKWWIFGADFSRFTQSLSRFIRDINGEKKQTSLLMIFFTVSFSRFAPSRNMDVIIEKRGVVPNITNSQRAQRSKKFEISSENENFERE